MIQTYSYTFDGSGTDNKLLQRSGGFFGLFQTTSAIDVTLNSGGTASKLEGIQTIMIKERFQSVLLTSATAQTVKVILADEESVDFGVLLSSLPVTLNGNATHSTSQTTVGVVQTSIIAQNANAAKRIIKNHNSSVVPVYIGPSGVTVSNGLELMPDEKITVTTNAEIFAISTVAGQTVSTFEEVK